MLRHAPLRCDPLSYRGLLLPGARHPLDRGLRRKLPLCLDARPLTPAPWLSPSWHLRDNCLPVCLALLPEGPGLGHQGAPDTQLWKDLRTQHTPNQMCGPLLDRGSHREAKWATLKRGQRPVHLGAATRPTAAHPGRTTPRLTRAHASALSLEKRSPRLSRPHPPGAKTCGEQGTYCDGSSSASSWSAGPQRKLCPRHLRCSPRPAPCGPRNSASEPAGMGMGMVTTRGTEKDGP